MNANSKIKISNDIHGLT